MINILCKIFKINCNTAYFISWNGYENGKNITYGNCVMSFSHNDIKYIENDVNNYCLKLAKKFNPNVNDIHVIAFNKV